MRTIQIFRTTDLITKQVHDIEARPLQPQGWGFWIDGKRAYSGLTFTAAEIETKIDGFKKSPRIQLETIGQRKDDTITERHKTADLPFTKEDTTMTKANKVKSGLVLFGVRVTALVHWMRDHGFTLAEGRHVITSQGITIAKKPAAAKDADIRDHSIRAHFSKKCCAAAAPKLDAEHVATINKLRKETPKPEPRASKPAKAAKPAKAGKVAKPKARKKTARKAARATGKPKSAKPSKAKAKRATKPAEAASA